LTRAATFFSTVLGWSYGPGSTEQGRQVEGSTPQHGMWGAQERPNLHLCYGVNDIGAAIERVRAAGGRADEPTDEPYGTVAMPNPRGRERATALPAGPERLRSSNP